MTEIMATVKLARGQIAFFDDLTRIHLTVSHNIAPVYAGMNTSRLRTALTSGRIELASGTLSSDEAIENERKVKAKALKTSPVSMKEPAPAKQEEPKVAEKPTEKAEAKPEVKEEKVEEKPKAAPKRTTSKRTTAKKETPKAEVVEEAVEAPVKEADAKAEETKTEDKK